MLTKFLVLSVIASIIMADIFESETNKLYPLSIIHINDFHARFEETDPSGDKCIKPDECIGGYARLVSKVKELKEKHKDKNSIYLNAGDYFQGTLWYNIGRWNVTASFFNLYPPDVTTIGNHEFDNGIDGLVPFLENLNTEIVVANIDDRLEPKMQGKYKKSVILERGGRKIGVIGVIWEFTNDIASTEGLKFYNESIIVQQEAAKLKKQGVNIIIVLTHCGYDSDQVIAKHAGHDVDIIVGAHTHSLLWNGTEPFINERVKGPYPTSVYQESGHRVLIVQASSFARFVGDLTVYFDNDGNIVSYEGKPHYLSNSVEQDPEIMEALLPWRAIVNKKGNEVIGSSKVHLSNKDCRRSECNLGNFFTDAIIYSYVNKTSFNDSNWTDVAIAIINNGALRVPLEIGNLTYSNLISMSPFENKIQSFSIKGRYLKEALEHAIKFDIGMVLGKNIISTSMLQISGLRILANVTKPDGHRIRSVLVRCQKCTVPKYQLLRKNEVYRIACPTFLANGGDGFTVIAENKFDEIVSDLTDIDVSVNYVKQFSPIITSVEGRITILH